MFTKDDLQQLLAGAKGSARSARIAPLDELVATGAARSTAFAPAASTASAPSADAEPSAAPWGLDVVRGRFVEVSGDGATAALTTAAALVLEAQRAGEPTVWIGLRNSSFYPPDVADAGVDLAALVVIRVRDATQASRAAEHVLASGAFGLVILDFAGAGVLQISLATQGRLASLAQLHDAALVALTHKPAAAESLGSLVSLRAEALRLHAAEHGPRVLLRALKDKRRGLGWSHGFAVHRLPGM